MNPQQILPLIMQISSHVFCQNDTLHAPLWFQIWKIFFMFHPNFIKIFFIIVNKMTKSGFSNHQIQVVCKKETLPQGGLVSDWVFHFLPPPSCSLSLVCSKGPQVIWFSYIHVRFHYLHCWSIISDLFCVIEHKYLDEFRTKSHRKTNNTSLKSPDITD